MSEYRTISTEEELDALPYGTIVLDKENSPYQRHEDVPEWYNVYGGEESPQEVLVLGPVQVIFEPEVPKPVLPTTVGSRIKIEYLAACIYDEAILTPDDGHGSVPIWRVIKQNGKYGWFGWFEAGEDATAWTDSADYTWELLQDTGAK